MQTGPLKPQQPIWSTGNSVPTSRPSLGSEAAGNLGKSLVNSSQHVIKNDDVSFIPSTPVLSSPVFFSPEAAAIALGALQKSSTENQLNNASSRVKDSQKKMQDINEQSLKKIETWAKNCAEAEKKSKWMGVLGVFIKSLAVVGAIALVGMTGGASTPLLVVAVVGVVGAGISLASDINVIANDDPSKAFGPTIWMSQLMTEIDPNISEKNKKMYAGLIGLPLIVMDPSFMGMFVSGIAEHAGADAAQSAIVMTTFTIVAGLVIALGASKAASSAAAAGAGAAGAGGAGGAGAVSGSVLAENAAMVQRCTALLSGTLSVPNAVITGLKAVDSKNADDALVEKEVLDNDSIALKKILKDGQEDMKKFYADLMEQLQAVSSIINENAKSISQTTKNLNSGTV